MSSEMRTDMTHILFIPRWQIIKKCKKIKTLSFSQNKKNAVEMLLSWKSLKMQIQQTCPEEVIAL